MIEVCLLLSYLCAIEYILPPMLGLKSFLHKRKRSMIPQMWYLLLTWAPYTRIETEVSWTRKRINDDAPRWY
jgi:hypothetical protein